MENQQPQTNPTLLAGYAKIDITPDFSVGLGGYSNAETRRSVAVEDPIFITCIALTEGEETILLYTIDNCACARGTADQIREVVTPATGIPGEKIFCAATHSHNCPSFMNDPEGKRYKELFFAKAVEAAQKALADRAPAETFGTYAVFEKMNFTRHYLLDDGTNVSQSSIKGRTPVAHSSPPDPQAVLVKFARENKRDILLVNWQGHPDCSNQAGKLNISPSFPGPLRDTLEAGTGMEVAYFTGADGNVVINSKLPEEHHNLTYRQYAVKMATLFMEALKDLKPIAGSGIATRREIFEVEIDHSWDHLLPQANEIYDLWKATDKPTGDAAGKPYGFSSVYQARAIRSRAAMDKTGQLELNAFRVGGIGFTTGTYEMFAESGTAVKDGSPYEITFLLTGNSSYIPSLPAFNYRCYEADTGFYAAGTAEKLVEKYLEMLKSIQ